MMTNSTVSYLFPTFRAKDLSPTATDTLVIAGAGLLSATLIYYLYYSTSASPRGAKSKSNLKSKAKAKSQSSNDGASQTAEHLSSAHAPNADADAEEDPFRDCDFSSVKVSKILIHPIKVQFWVHI